MMSSNSSCSSYYALHNDEDNDESLAKSFQKNNCGSSNNMNSINKNTSFFKQTDFKAAADKSHNFSRNNISASPNTFHSEILKNNENVSKIKHSNHLNSSHSYSSDGTAEISEDTILALSRGHGFSYPNKSYVTTEAAQIIAHTIEFRIRQIIEKSMKYMLHSRRASYQGVLTASDIRMALQALKMDPCIGYSRNSSYKFIGSCRSFRGDRIVRREAYRISHFNEINNSLSPKVRLVELIYQDVSKPAPLQPTISIHWLAIEGEALTCFENSSFETKRTKKGHSSNRSSHFSTSFSSSIQNIIEDFDINKMKNQSLCSSNKPRSGKSTFDAETNDMLEETVEVSRKVVDFEQNKSCDSIDTSRNENSNNDKNNSKLCLRIHDSSSSSVISASNFFSLAFENAKSDPIILPKIQHILGKEQLQFIEQIKTSIRNLILKVGLDSFRNMHKLFRILRESPALEQLLPYLCCFFANELNSQLSLGCTYGASILIRFADSLIQNPYHHLHHYAHQLLYPMLCAVLSNKVSGAESYCQRALNLRILAANTIGNLSKAVRYNKEKLEHLDFILIDIYTKYIYTPEVSLHSCFGAIHGVLSLGEEASQNVLKPILPTLLECVLKSSEIDEIEYSLQKEEIKQIIELRRVILNQLQLLIISCFCSILEKEMDLILQDLFAVNSHSASSAMSLLIPSCYSSLRQSSCSRRWFSNSKQPQLSSFVAMLSSSRLFDFLGEKFLPYLSSVMRKIFQKYEDDSDVVFYELERNVEEKLNSANRNNDVNLHVKSFVESAKQLLLQMYDVNEEVGEKSSIANSAQRRRLGFQEDVTSSAAEDNRSFQDVPPENIDSRRFHKFPNFTRNFVNRRIVEPNLINQGIDLLLLTL